MQQAVRAVPGTPQNPAKLAMQSRIEAVEEEARSRGFEAGLEEGIRQGLEEGRAQGLLVGQEEGRLTAEAAFKAEVQSTLDQYRDALQQRLASLDAQVEARLDVLSHELAPAAIEAVRRVINVQLQEADLGLAERIREVLGEVKGTSRLTIRFNPVDGPALQELDSEIRQRLAGLDRLYLTEDETVEAGCVVEFDGGEIDLRIARTLQRMAQGVLGRSDA